MSENAFQIDTESAAAENSPRLDRAFIQDPHALYRQLNTKGPAHRVEIWGEGHAWLVTRYDEARALLTDPRLSKNRQGLTRFFPADNHDPYRSMLNSHMLLQDPPDHTRLRKLLAKAFTASSVRKMRPDVVGIADELLDGIAVAARNDAAVDLMSSYAVRLPLGVIDRLLVVPPDDRDRFRTHVEPLLTSSNPAALGRPQRR